MARWLGGSVARWLDGSMARWLDGSTARRLDGSMAWWLDGSMARWLGYSALLVGVPLLMGATAGQCCQDDSDCEAPSPCTSLICLNKKCALDPIQPPGCCKNDLDCSDAQACTTDTCTNGVCAHAAIAECCSSYFDEGCSDGNPCTDDYCCSKAECDPGPVAGAFGCAHDWISGCCQQDADCVELPDNKVCVNGWCRFPEPIEQSCSDPSECSTLWQWVAELAQDYAKNCIASLTAYRCESGYCSIEQNPGCCATNEDCMQPCLNAECTIRDTSEAWTCQQHLCPTYKSCQPSSFPWCRFDSDCKSGNPLITATCAKATKTSRPECIFTPMDDLGCPSVCATKAALPICGTVCDDGNVCTSDRCRGTLDVWAELFGQAPPPNGPEAICDWRSVPGCCNSAADCPAPDRCLDVQCIQNGCKYSLNSTGCCESDSDCMDHNGCTKDLCQNGKCGHITIHGCCETQADCDDNQACTNDFCAPYEQHCYNVPISDCCLNDQQCKTGQRCFESRCVDIPPEKSCSSDSDCHTDLLCVTAVCGGKAQNQCVYSLEPGCCPDNLRLVVVEEGLLSPLESALDRLRADWLAEGACVKVIPWDNLGSPDALRALLRSLAIKADLRGALLIGNIQPKLFEYAGLGQLQGLVHKDAVDLYFADLDGDWSDNPFTINVLTPEPDDGLESEPKTIPQNTFVDLYEPIEYDEFGPGPDIVIGRLLVPLGGVYGSVAESIALYLNKAHMYRYGGAELYPGGMRGLAFTGWQPEYIGKDVKGMLHLFEENEEFYENMKCSLDSYGVHLDVVHSAAGTPEELLTRMLGGYGWISVGTHGAYNEFELANTMHLNDADIQASWQIGADFFHIQGCNSAALHTIALDGEVGLLESTYLTRMVFMGQLHGLVGLGHAGEGITACRLDVMYDSLRQGLGIGESVMNMVRQVVLDEINGNYCDQFYGQQEFLVRIIGDPFLRVY